MFELPKLSYAYNALEPHIDARTMEIHHVKHHAGYTQKLNAAIEEHEDLQKKSIEELLMSLNEVPKKIYEAVKNNGGGYYNHTIFWTIMSPQGGGTPNGNLMKAIEAKFESFENFKDIFSNTAKTLFGSGWTWLTKDENNNLAITSTKNQDSPISENKKPLLTLDVWEHAYYLKYQNMRTDYVDAWWEVINWQEVERRFEN